jgi:hypothetical protein
MIVEGNMPVAVADFGFDFQVATRGKAWWEKCALHQHGQFVVQAHASFHRVNTSSFSKKRSSKLGCFLKSSPSMVAVP